MNHAKHHANHADLVTAPPAAVQRLLARHALLEQQLAAAEKNHDAETAARLKRQKLKLWDTITLARRTGAAY